MLFRNLEFAGIDDFSVFIAKLEDVNATIKIRQVHDGLGVQIGDFVNFLTKKIEDLEIVVLIV